MQKMKIVFSPSRRKNEETYKDQGDVLCIVCGKPTHGKSKYIHMTTDLEAVDEMDEAKVGNSQGFFMIGSECAKKFPKSFLF